MPNTVLLYSVGIATAAIGLLGWTVFLSNKKSTTHRTFFFFSLVSILWNLANFLVYQVPNVQVGLWFVRLNLFFAVWYTFLLYKLFYVFPDATANLPERQAKIIYTIVSVVSLITLTPWVLGRVLSVTVDGHVKGISNGPLIPVFGVTVVSLIGLSFFRLIKKIRDSTEKDRNQYRFVLAGAGITFTLYVTFNLILPTVYGRSDFITLGAVFTFPFIFFTSYAIRSGKILNVKSFATGIISFFVLALTFIEVLTSNSILETALRTTLFIALLFFAFSLVSGVNKEIEQRAELSDANDKLHLANDHLKILDQAKSEFVSIASHQLRTPMTGIMGYLSMMTQGDFGKIAPEHQKILVDLLGESQRMIRLINQFLNVSKIEAGKFSYTKKLIQLEDIVARVVKELEKPAADKGLKLTVKYPKAKLPLVPADADKLEDVVLNLIDNAIKYTAKGSLTITFAQPDDAVKFMVKDTGIGIKPADATELFNKFVRGTGIAQIHPDGSGLGLFIAKSIIDSHGGRIWADSEGEGQGSTFQFTLPIHPTADTILALNAAAHVSAPRDGGAAT